MWSVSCVSGVGVFMLWCVFQVSLLFKYTLVARLTPVLLDSLSFSPPLHSSVPCSPHCFAGTAKGWTSCEAGTCLQLQPKELLLPK